MLATARLTCMHVGAERRERQARETRAAANRDVARVDTRMCGKRSDVNTHVKQAEAHGRVHGQAQVERASWR
jgi:hypothetical protein